jgi:DNA-binding HxlR family transcriptional regulator
MKNSRSHCPISFALDLFGDRWTLLILRDVMLKNKFRFQDLLDCEEKIATNVLADRLRKLEASGILSKTDDPDSGRQFRYAPTAKGLDLLPVLLEIIRWSGRYDPKTAAPREFLRRLDRDTDGVCAALRRSASPDRLVKARKTRKKSAAARAMDA